MTDGEFENLLVTNDFMVSKAVGGIFQAGKFLNSTSDKSAEIIIGQSVANDACLVVGYNNEDNKGYIQIYGDSPYDAVSILDGGQVVCGNESGGDHLVINDVATARWSLSTGNYLLSFGKHVSGSTFDRLVAISSISSNGGLLFAEAGGGDLPTYDVNLYRGGDDLLKTSDHLAVDLTITGQGIFTHGSASSSWGFIGKVDGDSNPRFVIDCNGKISWNDPTGTEYDTNLYRSAANVLKTSGSFLFDKGKSVMWNDANDEIRVEDNPSWASGYGNVMTLETYNGAWIFRNSASTAYDVFEFYYNGGIKALTSAGGTLLELSSAGQLSLPTPGSSGGIVFGGNVNLYRDYPYVTLATDADFTVGGGNLNINASSAGSPISRIKFTTYDDEEEERSTYIEATCSGLMDQTKPIIKTQYGLFVGGDISGYGFLGSATDPNSPTGTGGGAILMGHAFTDSSDMPCISLTDINYQTLWIKKNDGVHTLLTELEWGDLELGNLTAHGNVLPSSSNVYHVGTNTQYWNGVWANYLKYHTECSSFDEIDDLETLKKIRTINDEEGRQIHDPETLTHLKDADGFYSQERMDGWHISIQKRLLARIETLEKEVEKLAGLLGAEQVD